MKKHIFFLILSLIFIRTYNRKLFQVGTTQYTMRITNLTDCQNNQRNFIFTDIKLVHNGNFQYISGKFNITEDFCTKLMSVNINRCLNHNYVCEYFQTWNISDLCIFVKMKSSIWRPFYDAIKPSNWLKNCPCVKKGILTVTNGTVDLKELIKFYSEAPKYYWQVKTKLFDMKNIEQQCVYLTFYLTSYNSKIPVHNE